MATKVLVDVSVFIELLKGTVPCQTVKVNDAVCVIGREVVRVSANEVCVVDWDGDSEWLTSSELEIAVTELICQTVVVVVHVDEEGWVGRVEPGVQVESQLVTWLVFAGGRHGSASTFIVPSS